MRKGICFASLVSVGLMLGASSAIADGTETLGPPGIPIASGTGVVAGGTGMVTQPGSISVDIPGNVVQVLLYWEGQMATNVPGDDTIDVDGNSVTGTLIGGQTFFFSGAYSSAFRADITGLGLVGPGPNTLSVDGLAFTKVANGAGVLVIFDDGSTTTNIQVRDGVDLAFINFNEPRKSTIPQAFNFAPAAVDRTADLAMFFSSVSGSVSTGAFRPSSIEVMVDGTTSLFSNQLDSNDGEEWDTVNADFLVPAGASMLTVQAFSRDDFGDGQDPLAASFAWTAAALSLVTPPGGEGCTPGFWKNHLELWVGVSPGDDFDTTFGVDLFDPDITLGQAVRLGGGGVKKLARHGTAALVNALHPGVAYPLSVAEVIAAVQAGDADTLAGFNELGCDID